MRCSQKFQRLFLLLTNGAWRDHEPGFCVTLYYTLFVTTYTWVLLWTSAKSKHQILHCFLKIATESLKVLQQFCNNETASVRHDISNFLDGDQISLTHNVCSFWVNFKGFELSSSS